jgi:ubiquinone biosynthesis protein
MNPISDYKNINRYRQIITVFLKYGFDDFVSGTGLKRFLPFKKRISKLSAEKKYVDYTRAERIRLAIEELGPTFIKMGQVLSNRHDLLPKGLVDELSKLQDNVPPIAHFNVNQHVEKLLGINVADHFNFIEGKALASASVAQVHKAQLKNGSDVALKILRPNVHQVVRSDISILKDMARRAAKRFPAIAELQPEKLIRFFERTIFHELNFIQEAAHIERFRKHFGNDVSLHVPKVYAQYSNKNLLCLEFVDGIKITHKEALIENGIDIKEITKKGTEVYFKMVYEHGFFHADPHPGNLLVLRNSKLCFLDFGMMGSILPEDKEILGGLLMHFLRQDVYKVVHALEKLTESKSIAKNRELYYDIYDLMQEVNSQQLKDLKLRDLLEKFHTIIFHYKIYLPSDFFLLIRAFVVMEGLGQQINPEFNIIQDLKPHVRKMVEQKIGLKNFYQQSQNYLMDFRELMKDAPSDFKTILDHLKDGKMTFGFEHRGLEGLNQAMQQATNRIALAIITAALVIGSSLVVLSGLPPLVLNIPILGVVGFLFSLFLGIWTIFNILKKK